LSSGQAKDHDHEQPRRFEAFQSVVRELAALEGQRRRRQGHALQVSHFMILLSAKKWRANPLRIKYQNSIFLIPHHSIVGSRYEGRLVYC
jgi:hypothetical protein